MLWIRRALPVLLLAAVCVAGCGGKGAGVTKSTAGKSPPGAAQAASTATTATAAKAKPRPVPASPKPGTCARVAAPKPKGAQHLPRPGTALDAKHTYAATVDTNCGKFTIALDVRRAPKTTASFAYLARRSFYDNLTFQRIVPGFVIQGGDPLGTGQGGPGYSVVERPPPGLRYTRGVVAMAKTAIEDPGTSGSQFYVVTGPDAQLPAEYALVGKVVAGQDVVDTIGIQPTDTNPAATVPDKPLHPVVIRSITITEHK